MIEVVHQLIASLAPHDAISQHTRILQSMLADEGLGSFVWYEAAHGAAADEGRHFRDFVSPAPVEHSLFLYQLSTGSEIGDWLLERPEQRVVDYHNITPVGLFAPWEPIVGGTLLRGHRQLRELGPGFVLGVADSAFNERDLREAGCPSTAVAPVLVDLDTFDVEPDRATRIRLDRDKAAGGTDWLFVGRIAPNKCQHDLVKALAIYRRLVDPRARLRLVGGLASDSYRLSIRRYASALGVADAVDLAGEVTDSVLAAYYQTADVFVCASAHEGFCVPLLEAMYHRLPIVAHRVGAVAETVGQSGLLLAGKAPLDIALAVQRVLEDRRLREDLVGNGERRVADFSLKRTKATMWSALRPTLRGESAEA